MTDKFRQVLCYFCHNNLIINLCFTGSLKGFYYIARDAEVPIVLAYIDYKDKEVGIKKVFMPTGDVEKDMRMIKSYYKSFHARRPENFVTGL